uniref:Uncharacterized protein n=1 Tax=uncultured marine group II/III euryarchaeote SAT1000_07_H02 TaxID=1456555 RepID=A0A075I863_9EURY|nr:hypothetical protein [uncultured marine group II/III euryarchaeote SAT1000_07_H02]
MGLSRNPLIYLLIDYSKVCWQEGETSSTLVLNKIDNSVPLPEIMYFTLIFTDHSDGPTPKYDLVFHPSPIWMKDGIEIINLGGHSPRYELGYFQKLIDDEDINSETQDVAICVHTGGHGHGGDLQLLLEDVENYNFESTVVLL